MDTGKKRAMRRMVMALLLGGGLGGCAVYAPPYAPYDAYYPGYAYPAYVGPPVSLDFGFYEHRHHGYYGGHRRGWGAGGGHYRGRY
jgi:hypothetical protein